ncbi:HNH endonuclease [Orientia tsutsugamushi]|uniref:HNH endonuclease n=2 Tax=Orientia tsutsugamushi TaxID=784 RepID=UPI0013A5BD6C
MFKSRQILWRRQKGKCLVCFDLIDNGESVHVHHITPIRCGGTDHINNLCLLHENCHRQVHSNRGQLIAAVCKLLEPYAEYSNNVGNRYNQINFIKCATAMRISLN